ncbi:Homeodomain-like protein, partial [Mycena galopus ATCC 62051]
MPRIKPHVPVRTHYSKDLKQRVIYQRFTLGYKPTKIAIHLNIPLRVVQRVITTWKEIGEVARDRTYIGRAPMLSPAHIKFMLALLEHTPDMYLDEIQEQLYNQHDVDTSLATLSRTLARLGISSKK